MLEVAIIFCLRVQTADNLTEKDVSIYNWDEAYQYYQRLGLGTADRHDVPI